MRNCKIGPTETKVPYISDNEEGLLVFLLFYIRITLKIASSSLLSPSYNYFKVSWLRASHSRTVQRVAAPNGISDRKPKAFRTYNKKICDVETVRHDGTREGVKTGSSGIGEEIEQGRVEESER